MNDVSVIILNYNSSDYTIKCVNSIIDFTSRNIKYEILVVDNNSNKNDFDKLKLFSNNDKIRILRNKINSGFSGGNNFGLQNSSSKYVFFLNNDCELINDNISVLLDFMEKNENVALCSGQMYDENLKMMKTINYLPTLSLKLLGNSFLRFFNPQDYPDYKREYNKPLKVQGIAGASLFFNRKKLEEIGGFDLNYFLYLEEEDIAQSILKYNYEIYLVPQAKYIHYLSKSTKINFQSKREYYISLMYYFRKHNNFFVYSLLKYYYFIKLFRKFYKNKQFAKLAFFVLKGAPEKYSLRYKQKENSE